VGGWRAAGCRGRSSRWIWCRHPPGRFPETPGIRVPVPPPRSGVGRRCLSVRATGRTPTITCGWTGERDGQRIQQAGFPRRLVARSMRPGKPAAARASQRAPAERRARRREESRSGDTNAPVFHGRTLAKSPSAASTRGADLTEQSVREAWLRAEAGCECTKETHGHLDRCEQFLVWAARGGTGKGAWEARPLRDPQRPPCDILCADCYAKLTGRPTRADQCAGI
jgi:hypothetical protein